MIVSGTKRLFLRFYDTQILPGTYIKILYILIIIQLIEAKVLIDKLCKILSNEESRRRARGLTRVKLSRLRNVTVFLVA